MELDKVLLIILGLMILFIFFNKKVEHFESIGGITEEQARNIVTQIYDIDVQSIKNLELIAKKLQDGGITIPGNATIKGDLTLEAKLNILPKGIIVAWNGDKAPNGWAICDGTNGTPDLRDKFIMGAGNTFKLNDKGGNQNIRLSVNQLPAHTHTIQNAGIHQHMTQVGSMGINAGYNLYGRGIYNYGEDTGSAGKKDLFSTYEGEHSHIATTTGENKDINIMNPYYTLTFIMKL